MIYGVVFLLPKKYEIGKHNWYHERSAFFKEVDFDVLLDIVFLNKKTSLRNHKPERKIVNLVHVLLQNPVSVQKVPGHKVPGHKVPNLANIGHIVPRQNV